MKKILLITVLSCFIFTLQAQKCKYDYEKTDPFTGKSGKGIVETLENSWKIELNKTDQDFFIALHLRFAGISNDIINVGDTLMIAIENGKPLILKSLTKVTPISDAVQVYDRAVIQSFYTPTYQATLEQINQLAVSNITSIKIYFNDKWYSLDIETKKAKKIVKAANCMLK